MNGSIFEINQLPFVDDTALVARRLCRPVTELIKVFKIRQLQTNVSKSKVIRCSRYVNRGRMHVRLNGETSDEVNCLF